jgi:plastocyanin
MKNKKLIVIASNIVIAIGAVIILILFSNQLTIASAALPLTLAQTTEENKIITLAKPENKNITIPSSVMENFLNSTLIKENLVTIENPITKENLTEKAQIISIMGGQFNDLQKIADSIRQTCKSYDMASSDECKNDFSVLSSIHAMSPITTRSMTSNEDNLAVKKIKKVDDSIRQTCMSIKGKSLDECKNDFSVVSTSETLLKTLQKQPGDNTRATSESQPMYDPSTVTVKRGAIVNWINHDNQLFHTVTSGTADGGPSGLFDSGIIAENEFFEYVFNEEGVFHYYCVLHPTMQGTIIVE